MRRALAALAALAAVTACAPDLPEAPVGPDRAVDGASIADDVVAAARSAGLADCPERGAADATELAGPALTCLRTGAPTDLGTLAGSPVVVNVWAHWCTECREELPLLARAAEEYAGRVTFVGVLFADEDPAAAIELARASGVTYLHVADTGSELKVPLALRGLPQTAFLDASGTRVGVEYAAFRDYDDLTEAIESQLGVSPP